MQQNITFMLHFCASDLALSSVTPQLIWLMDHVGWFALSSSSLFVMLYIQWEKMALPEEGLVRDRQVAFFSARTSLCLATVTGHLLQIRPGRGLSKSHWH